LGKQDGAVKKKIDMICIFLPHYNQPTDHLALSSQSCPLFSIFFSFFLYANRMANILNHCRILFVIIYRSTSRLSKFHDPSMNPVKEVIGR
jgi:hypothetical protein